MGDGAEDGSAPTGQASGATPSSHRIPEETPHWQILNQLFQQPATRLSDMANWALACELQHLDGSSQQAERSGGAGAEGALTRPPTPRQAGWEPPGRRKWNT